MTTTNATTANNSTELFGIITPEGRAILVDAATFKAMMTAEKTENKVNNPVK